MVDTKQKKQILCIGDCTVDAFVKLHDASVQCDVNHEHCMLCMSFADKIPYENLTVVPGVGNAANVAVATSRLGHNTAFVSAIGDDRHGKDILEVFEQEGVDAEYVAVNEGKQTNYHFVLSFQGERTILIKHEQYEYPPISDVPVTEWMFFSSIGEGTEQLHEEIADFVEEHGVNMGFNPGTFQMEMGKEKLASIYRTTHVLFLNREEAQRVLEVDNSDIAYLAEQLHALGPAIVCITDGPEGAYVSCVEGIFFMPPYPDIAPPKERTGAGDSFSAAFMAALMYGLKPEEAIMWAPINSMNVVQHIGAQKGLLTKDALLAYLEKSPEDYRPKKM